MSNLLNPYRFGAAGDPFWSDVELLIQGDEADLSTTIVDSSANAFTVTRTNVEWSTTIGIIGASSIRFNADGDELSVSDDPALEMGASPFTLEGHYHFTDVGTANQDLLSKYLASANNRSWRWWCAVTTGNIRFLIDTAGDGTGITIFDPLWAPTVDTTYHLAVCRDDSDDVRFFADGVQQGSTLSMALTAWNNTQEVQIGEGASSDPRFYCNGIRYTKAARYTTNFTPPATFFPTS